MISFDFFSCFFSYGMRDMAYHKYVMHGFMWYFMKTTISHEIPLNAMTSLLFCHPLNRALYFGAEAGFNYLFFIVWAYFAMVCYFMITDV
jgi:hypothetical protein